MNSFHNENKMFTDLAEYLLFSLSLFTVCTTVYKYVNNIFNLGIWSGLLDSVGLNNKPSKSLSSVGLTCWLIQEDKLP